MPFLCDSAFEPILPVPSTLETRHDVRRDRHRWWQWWKRFLQTSCRPKNGEMVIFGQRTNLWDFFLTLDIWAEDGEKREQVGENEVMGNVWDGSKPFALWSTSINYVTMERSTIL